MRISESRGLALFFQERDGNHALGLLNYSNCARHKITTKIQMAREPRALPGPRFLSPLDFYFIVFHPSILTSQIFTFFSISPPSQAIRVVTVT